jgi:hypothetical protein
MPFAFTEQGVAMLSSVLNSERDIHDYIAIMRAFVQMRRFLKTHRELALKIEELERTVSSHDENIQLIFETIRQENRDACRVTTSVTGDLGYGNVF